MSNYFISRHWNQKYGFYLHWWYIARWNQRLCLSRRSAKKDATSHWSTSLWWITWIANEGNPVTYSAGFSRLSLFRLWNQRWRKAFRELLPHGEYSHASRAQCVFSSRRKGNFTRVFSQFWMYSTFLFSTKQEYYHPLDLEVYHSGLLRFEGGPNKSCETARNSLAVASPAMFFLDPTTGILSASAALGSYFLCDYLSTPIGK